MEPQNRLTDTRLRSLLKQPRAEEDSVPDGAIPGLHVRLFPGGGSNWTLFLRVAGEGGVNEHGRPLVGRKHRVSLGSYPTVSIQAARAKANNILEQAKQGINPKAVTQSAATAGGMTVEALSKEFMTEHVYSRNLDSSHLYANAFKIHINPQIGERLADLVTREEVRAVMDKARIKRRRPSGERGPPIGGVEAARTTISVLRHMYSWAADEGKIKRKENPCSKMTKNLPKKRQGEIVLTLPEARIVWQAARDCGYPFGTQAQLQLLTSLRVDNWASAEAPWIDLDQALAVIPADSYKSDHVHVLPLVPSAIEILKGIPKPARGPYILSTTGGSRPIQGMSKFYRTRLRNQIIANTGAPLAKRITSQTLRRTVATGIAAMLGYEGEKLVKRVLGHADSSVTAIYNRYGYVREMRHALEQWANELMGAGSEKETPESEHSLIVSARAA